MSTPRYHFIIVPHLAITNELAELVGILLGDGHIGIYNSKGYSTHYEVKISFDKILEQEYIRYVSLSLKKTLNEKAIVKHRKDSNASDIFIFKKNIVLALLAIGMKKAPKWKRAVIPHAFLNPTLGRHVLRGYFDTDGSVVVTDNNGTPYVRLEMKICPSPMQRQFLYLLDLYGFHYGCYEIGKGEVRIQMNGTKALERWKNEIGFSNQKHRNKVRYFYNLQELKQKH